MKQHKCNDDDIFYSSLSEVINKHMPPVPIHADDADDADIFFSMISDNVSFIGKVNNGYSKQKFTNDGIIIKPKVTPFIFKSNSESILMMEYVNGESTEYKRMDRIKNPKLPNHIIHLEKVNHIDRKPINTIINCKIGDNVQEILKDKFTQLQYGCIMLSFAFKHGGLLINENIKIYKKYTMPYLRITKVPSQPSEATKIVLGIKSHYVKQGKMNIHLVYRSLRDKTIKNKQTQGILCQSNTNFVCGINGCSGISSNLILINPLRNKYRLMSCIPMVQGDQFGDLKCITKSYASGFCRSNDEPRVKEIFLYPGISEILYADIKSKFTEFSNFNCLMKIKIYHIHSANSIKYKVICKNFGKQHINSNSFDEIKRKCQHIVFGKNCDASDGQDSIYMEIKGRNEYTSTRCYKCGQKYTLKQCKCPRCRVVRYCSKRCQKRDWKQHRLLCLTFQLRKYDINDGERFHRGI